VNRKGPLSMKLTLLTKLIAVLAIIGTFVLTYAIAIPAYASPTHTQIQSPNTGFPPNAIWWWTGTNIQAWLGTQECDNVSGVHYNLHVQNKGGGVDFHNYHISAIPGYDPSYYNWKVVDTGGTRSVGERDYSYGTFFTLGDASSYVAGDFTYDIGNDTGDNNFSSAVYNIPISNFFATVYNDRNLACEHRIV